jgi:hypothetical protein
MIGIFGGIILIMRIYDSMLRDKMVFQEYDWGFDPNNPGVAAGNGKASDPWDNGGNQCVGPACCNTSEVFDPVANMCVPGCSLNPAPVSRESSILGDINSILGGSTKDLTNVTNSITSAISQYSNVTPDGY